MQPIEEPADEKPPPTLSRAELNHTVRGGTWTIAMCQVASQLVSLGVAAVLLRMIPPADYGQYGLVINGLLFVRIFATLGLNVTTIQRSELDEGQLNSLFWLNLALGVAGTLVTALAAPLLGFLPRCGPLVWPAVMLAGSHTLWAIGMQHQALLERHLRVGPLAVARIVSQAAGGVAGIGVAYLGGRMGALVAQHYAELAVLAGAAWWAEPWRPGRPRWPRHVGELVRFSVYYSGASLATFMTGAIDKALVYFALGDRSSGFYNQSFNLMLKPVYLLTTPLAGIVLPALSRASHDRVAYEKLHLAFSRLLAAVLFPASVGLALIAPEVMRTLGGPEWVDAGPVLSVLAMAILAQGFINIASYVMTSAGRTDLLFRANWLLVLLTGVALTAGIRMGVWFDRPLMGVAWGYTLVTGVVWFVPYMLFTLSTIEVAKGRWFLQLARPALASAGMGFVVWFVQQLYDETTVPHYLQVVTEIAVGIAAYSILAIGEVRWFWKQLSLFRAQRNGATSSPNEMAQPVTSSAEL
jgi:PST family polysaccharide transporter